VRVRRVRPTGGVATVVASFAVVLTLVAAAIGSAAGVDYPNFRSTKGLKLNGTAKGAGIALKLTPAVGVRAGSAFTKRKVVKSTKSFQTRFTFNPHDGSDSGDGIAFVLHPKGKGALGVNGGGLGYGGIEPSLAVEIDMFFNSTYENEPDADHVAIAVDGDHTSALEAAPIPFFLPDEISNFWVAYSAKSKRLRVFASEGGRRGSPLLNRRVNLRALFDGDRVRAGFTAATGSASQAHDLLRWKLRQRR
jgi:Legume lectin domain